MFMRSKLSEVSAKRRVQPLVYYMSLNFINIIGMRHLLILIVALVIQYSTVQYLSRRYLLY